jgi:hypothetical protein
MTATSSAEKLVVQLRGDAETPAVTDDDQGRQPDTSAEMLVARLRGDPSPPADDDASGEA